MRKAFAPIVPAPPLQTDREDLLRLKSTRPISRSALDHRPIDDLAGFNDRLLTEEMRTILREGMERGRRSPMEESPVEELSGICHRLRGGEGVPHIRDGV